VEVIFSPGKKVAEALVFLLRVIITEKEELFGNTGRLPPGGWLPGQNPERLSSRG
jgi:hypothetical protein